VTGIENLMTGKPSWLRTVIKPEREICLVGLNFEMAGTVNSPRRAMQ